MSLDHKKIINDMVTSWIGVLALVVAGAFAMFQYLESKQDSRVKETMFFLDRYNASPFVDARRRIAESLNKMDDSFQKINDQARFSEQDYDRLTMRTIKAEKMHGDVMEMIDFFEMLQICVNQKVCDDKTVVIFFHNEACSFFHQFNAKILFERQVRSDAKFGQDVIDLCRTPVGPLGVTSGAG